MEMGETILCHLISIDHKENLENSYSNKCILFAINFRNFWLQMAIHILNAKSTLKCLLDLWVFILQVIFVTQVSIPCHIIIMYKMYYMVSHVVYLNCELMDYSRKMLGKWNVLV